MNQLRGEGIKGEQSLLARLSPYTDTIAQDRRGVFRVTEHIETPCDEYGIVDKRVLFQRLLGSVASAYHWSGSFAGPHHLMWPRRLYQGSLTSREAATFRGSPSLKVILPRELHDYLHRVMEPPALPHVDIMHQYIIEQAQVSRLYDTVYHDNYREADVSFAQKELLRRDALLRKLDLMIDGQVGLMPRRELLAELPLTEVRQLLRRRAKPLGISAARACQRAFFADDIAA